MKILVESGEHISSITFPQQYLKDFKIVQFVPAPQNNYTSKHEIKYNFLPGQNLIVSIYLVPKNFGAVAGTMKVNETNSIQLNHFIFP